MIHNYVDKMWNKHISQALFFVNSTHVWELPREWEISMHSELQVLKVSCKLFCF